MTTRIILRDNPVSGSVPSPSDLLQAELVINTSDGRLFTKNSSGDIVLLTAPLIVSGTGSDQSQNSSTSSYVEWANVANKPQGLVSSSIQINTGSFSGSLIGTSSWASNAISASFITWTNIGSRPTGLVSSSAQINSGTYTGSFTGSFRGTSSFATSASWAPTFVPARVTTTMSTSVISSNTFQTGAITLAKGFVLYRVATSVPARVRIYSTTNARDNDMMRGSNVEPTGNHGVLLDMITVEGSLTGNLSPMPYCAVLDTVVSADVPYTITNNQTASVSVSASFTYLTLEL